MNSAAPLSSAAAAEKNHRMHWVQSIPFFLVHVIAVVGSFVDGDRALTAMSVSWRMPYRTSWPMTSGRGASP